MKAVIVKIFSIYGTSYHIKVELHKDGYVTETMAVVELEEDTNQPYKKQLIADAIKNSNLEVTEVIFPDFSTI